MNGLRGKLTIFRVNVEQKIDKIDFLLHIDSENSELASQTTWVDFSALYCYPLKAS